MQKYKPTDILSLKVGLLANEVISFYILGEMYHLGSMIAF